MSMAQFPDYCEENAMLFSEVCQDSSAEMPVDFPGATAYRVGSYSGSDNERKYLFPTPPDSPVFTELTPPNAPTKNHQGPQNGYTPGQKQHSGLLSDDCAAPAGAQPTGMEMVLELDQLLQNIDLTQGNQQYCEMPYNANMGLSDEFCHPDNSDFDNLGHLSFPSLHNDCLSDCSTNSPTASPSPNTVCDIDLPDGDLPNLDINFDFVNELTFGMCSQDSDFDNLGSGHSLSIDEIQPSSYNSLASSIMPHHHQQPPPLYHDRHHNIQPYNQFYLTNQRVYGNASAPPHPGRTHNYQCRTLRTTLKDGVVTQDMTSPQDGPIMSSMRPRKQSTSSDDVGSDEEHVVTKPAGGGRSSRNTNRGRGRGREQGSILWRFIRDLLKDETCCSKFIRWEDREAGIFKFINSEAVANMWGRKKNNQQMTYEKLSRAMRYYYKRGILERVDGRRLVYKFGKNAEGWKEAAGLQ